MYFIRALKSILTCNQTPFARKYFHNLRTHSRQNSSKCIKVTVWYNFSLLMEWRFFRKTEFYRSFLTVLLVDGLLILFEDYGTPSKLQAPWGKRKQRPYLACFPLLYQQLITWLFSCNLEYCRLLEENANRDLNYYVFHSFTLSTRSHMIVLVQFGIIKHSKT